MRLGGNSDATSIATVRGGADTILSAHVGR
jgi:hypothetical protein